MLEVEVDEFTIFRPVIFLPSSPSEETKIEEFYAYPNPAVSPEEPIIRAKLGKVDEVQITIFDITGQVVHSATVTEESQIETDGQYYYDYTWEGSKASGVYFAVVHGISAEGTVKGRTKFAVVK